MKTDLNDFKGKYTLPQVKNMVSMHRIGSDTKRQLDVGGIKMGSVEQKPHVETYAIMMVYYALNTPDNYGALMELRKRWKGGMVEACMYEDIKTGMYTPHMRMNYVSTKQFTGFVDENNGDYKFPITIHQNQEIKELYEYYDMSAEKICQFLKLPVSVEQLEEFIALSINGELDPAYKFICRKIKENGAFKHYWNDSVLDFTDADSYIDLKIGVEMEE